MSATAARTNGHRASRPRALPQIDEAGPGSLAEALLAFQAEAPKLTKNADGQIQSRSYKYVTLDGVLDDIQPLLSQHELLWTAKPALADGQMVMRYRMTHVPSAEFDEFDGPLPCVDPGPQALGSAVTYMRRYTLVAYLNLAPGEDDDGAAATRSGSTIPAAQPTAAPAKASERPASASQRKMLRAKARAAGLAIDDFANIIKIAGGERDPEPWQDRDAAERWVERALDRLPARLVDAVIEGIEGSKS